MVLEDLEKQRKIPKKKTLSLFQIYFLWRSVKAAPTNIITYVNEQF